jgi:hypothetical protein
MWIGLHTGRNVNSPKEIEFWNLHPPSGRRVGAVYAEGFNSQVRWGLIICGHCQNNTHTLVFRKKGLFGIWSDLYTLDIDGFWEIFGGKTIRLQWIID